MSITFATNGSSKIVVGKEDSPEIRVSITDIEGFETAYAWLSLDQAGHLGHALTDLAIGLRRRA